MRLQQTSGSRLINWQWLIAGALVVLAAAATVAGVSFAPSAAPALSPAQGAPQAVHFNPVYYDVYAGQAAPQAAPRLDFGTGSVYDPDFIYESAPQAAPQAAPQLDFGTGSVYDPDFVLKPAMPIQATYGAGYVDGYAYEEQRRAEQRRAASGAVNTAPQPASLGIDLPTGADPSTLPAGITDYIRAGQPEQPTVAAQPASLGIDLPTGADPSTLPAGITDYIRAR
jgi:hypothetical protein